MFPFDSFDATTANRFVSTSTHNEGEARRKVAFFDGKDLKNFRVSFLNFEICKPS
jgi:hypothetical protein